MATQLEKMLQETLGDLDNFSPEKIRSLMQEALKTFMAIKEKSQSEDPKEREEALTMAVSLRDGMQVQMEEFSKKAGIDSAQFASLAEDQENFTPETWGELNSVKKELEAFRDQVSKKPKKSKSAKNKKSTWLPT